ncbi:MAG TPA: hypothetical protein DCS82_06535 [Rhodospirillaceae bacterium]|nr:hypothetical protein [Rhodospirillaceae bacterium]
MYRRLRICFGILLVLAALGSAPNRASAAGLSEALSTLDTGPYKDAACKAAIDAVVGAVDGLGAAGFSNVKVEDDVISGDLSLPVAGSWSIYLFATDCSKSGFAVLKPKSDLKLSDLVGSVPGLNEVDKLGLNGQVFILSNTEGSLAAESAPDSLKSALSAAANGDDGVEIEVKAGLTVLGVMDLSKSTATSKGMSFLGFKDDNSSKIAINAFLGAEMMAAWLKGDKGKADFTLVGTLTDAAMTLPGHVTLPKATLTFSTAINADGKAFELDVAADDPWTKAFGIPGLTLSNAAINVKAGDETSASLSATTSIGGQALDVAWSAAKADDSAEVTLNIAAANDGTFKIGSIGGLSKVPGISDLGFKSLAVSTEGFSGRLIWKGKELDGAVIFTGESKKPLVLVKTETFDLKDISSAIGKTPLGKMTFPGMILTLAETDPGAIDAESLPEVAQAILGNLAEKSGGKIEFNQGVGMLVAIDAAKLGDAVKTVGASGELVIGGTLGGLFGGDPKVDLFAALPTFSSKKMPKFLKAVKGVTPQLNLAFKKSGGGFEADIGVDLRTDLKVGKDTVQLDTAVTAVVATSGVGLNIGGSLDVWENAFGLKGFTMSEVAMAVEVDADSSVSAAFQGTVTLKDGSTTFTIKALLSPDLAALGVPKEVVFDLETNQISLHGLMDLADVFIGATGNSATARAARGKGLFKTLQLDKLPDIEFLPYKNDKGELEKVQIYMATPGATDPQLDIDGMGFGIEGRLQIEGKDIAQAKAKLTESSFDFDGEILIHQLGPLKIKNAKLDAAASLSELPFLHIAADAVLLGVEQAIKIDFSSEKIGFELSDKFGQAFTSDISAEASVEDP